MTIQLITTERVMSYFRVVFRWCLLFGTKRDTVFKEKYKRFCGKENSGRTYLIYVQPDESETKPWLVYQLIGETLCTIRVPNPTQLGLRRRPSPPLPHLKHCIKK